MKRLLRRIRVTWALRRAAKRRPPFTGRIPATDEEIRHMREQFDIDEDYE